LANVEAFDAGIRKLPSSTNLDKDVITAVDPV
jgi:hypothetical protein